MSELSEQTPREELDELAAEAGVESPEKLKNKGEVLAAIEQATAPPEPEADAAEPEAAAVKQNDRAWWCPVCDTSATHLVTSCPKCGYRRDED